jgi:predicted MFS family arabinose efflux permease
MWWCSQKIGSMTESRSLIWRYYAFRATNTAGFYLPVAIVFLTDRGYSPAFVGFVYAAFSFAVLLAEVPTGYLGDLIGRRGSLAVGALFRAGTMLAYPLVDSRTAFLALHATWAVGWAFRSGTVDAWLYEVLKDRFDESEYARIESRGSVATLVVSAAAAVTGAVLYGVDPGLPFLVNGVVALLGLPILYTFPTVESDDGDGSVFGLRDAVDTLRLQVRRPEVRWLVAYAALFHALFSITRTFEQPALRAVGVPVAGLGLLYAGFKLVSAGAASTVGFFQDRLGARGVFAALVPVYGAAYGAVAFVPVLVVPVIFLNRGLRTITRPIRNQYLNDRLEDVGRATVLSGASMALSLSAGTAKVVGGVVASRLGPVGFLPPTGVAIALAGAGLWLAVSPVRGSGDAPGATPATGD